MTEDANTSANATDALLIGWASTDITPNKPVQLHGQFHERISQFVHDPCTATALALERTGPQAIPEQAMMVSCDLASVSRQLVEQVRASVHPRLPGFDVGKLIINATHTHTGPTLIEGIYREPAPGVMRPSQYAEFFVAQVSNAIVRAWKNRRPGAVSWALGHAAIGFNRRTHYADGTSKMYGSSDDKMFVGMEGGMDPGIEILFTWDQPDVLTGVLINVACPSQVVEGECFISADFWHPAREELRKRFSPNLFIYPMCSAAGDQSPRDLVRRNRGEPNMHKVEGMNELGRRLANAVQYAFHTAQSAKVRDATFGHHVEELSPPMRKVTPEEVEQARQAIAEISKSPSIDPSSAASCLLQRHLQVIRRFEAQGTDPRYAIDLHVIRLGEIAICTNPFELFLDYGLRIKARSKALQTFVVQLTNDSGRYLPTTRAVAAGSYGAMIADNLVGPAGGQMLVDRTVEVINSFWTAEAK